MLAAIELSLNHSCTISRMIRDVRVNFRQGAGILQEGDLLKGSVSKATGSLKELNRTSGDFNTGTAIGNILISLPAGSFLLGEEIYKIDEETGGGTLTVSRVSQGSDETNSPLYTEKITSYDKVRFDYIREPGGDITFRADGSGQFRKEDPILYLPPEASGILRGDIVKSSVLGFEGPYKVRFPKYLTELFSSDIDHIEAYLEALDKEA